VFPYTRPVNHDRHRGVPCSLPPRPGEVGPSSQPRRLLPRLDVPIPIEVILGSGGLAVFAVWVVNELWKAHKASDADVRSQRDQALDRLERVIGLAEKADKP
jgi:hypothetical protein